MRIVTAAGDVVGGDDVHVPDVSEQSQDAVDVGALEVEVDTPAVVRALFWRAEAGGEAGRARLRRWSPP